jgi:hypothetical protein
VWLVDERGEYEQTTERAGLLKHFFLKLSDVQDIFSDHEPPLKPLTKLLPQLLSDFVASAE